MCLVSFFVVLLSPIAGAHGERVSTRPADGAILDGVLDQVRIDLTETPSDRASVTVLDGCGVDVVDEIFTMQKTLQVQLDRGQPGEWSVAYKVVSKEDGHKTGDTFGFSVEGLADCSEPEDPAAPDETIAPDTGPGASGASGPVSEDQSLPVVPIIAGTLVLLVLALAVRSASSKM